MVPAVGRRFCPLGTEPNVTLPVGALPLPVQFAAPRVTTIGPKRRTCGTSPDEPVQPLCKLIFTQPVSSRVPSISDRSAARALVTEADNRLLYVWIGVTESVPSYS